MNVSKMELTSKRSREYSSKVLSILTRATLDLFRRYLVSH